MPYKSYYNNYSGISFKVDGTARTASNLYQKKDGTAYSVLNDYQKIDGTAKLISCYANCTCDEKWYCRCDDDCDSCNDCSDCSSNTCVGWSPCGGSYRGECDPDSGCNDAGCDSYSCPMDCNSYTCALEDGQEQYC